MRIPPTSSLFPALAFYERDPLYRFTEAEARELADEVLRLRAVIEEVLGRSDVGIVSYEILRKALL